MRRLAAAIVIAFLLWFVMFSQWTAPHLNFWGAMTFSACVLILLSSLSSLPSLWRGRGRLLSPLFEAIIIASLLYLLFWIGDKLSQELFTFARPQVDSIYQMKDGTPSWLIALLLLFIIGPAEELFWRGYVQRTLTQRWTANAGFVVTTLIYTAVHLPSMNFMLIMAAFTCGFCWGLLYRLFPQHFPAIVLSHALWDAAAFVWFPL
jgi:membrane protease YdiL (CAAX protease family)